MTSKPEFCSWAWWLDFNKKKIKNYLKVLGFFSLWLAVPVFLLMVMVGTSKPQPQIFQAETNPAASNEVNLTIKVKFKGVSVKNVANQPLFFKAVNPQNQLSSTFNPVMVSQDKADPELFSGNIKVDPNLIVNSPTFWIKGPVHLQRRFDGLSWVSQTALDFTARPLLPGDLILPDTGPDDSVDQLDQDYLWSLLAKTGRTPTKEEVRAADLDLDGKITGRDQSLLIDTGVGSKGEE